MHIGFLFNHHGGHQVAHALPVAMAMQRRAGNARISVLVSPEAEEQVRSLAKAHGGPQPEIVRLRPGARLARLARQVTGSAVPADLISFLARNLDTFRRLDALVVPEKTSLLLKSWFGLNSLKMVHTRHGAGDRAIGFDKASGKFDFVLLSGRKIRDRLDEAGLLKPDGHAIIGYPKFDFAVPPSPALFPQKRPVVLYNPHPSPALSSWYRMGDAVLDLFAKSKSYNLIFAPHVMLFKKRLTASLSPFALGWNRGVRPRHYDHDHMLIDTGSPACVDMTYTTAADIYLGDASSQIYEFIRNPRPCIFLNPHRIAWRGNPDFAHWHAGQVVETVDELNLALAKVLPHDESARERQRQMFDYSFDLQDRPSSDRGADAILDFLVRA